MLTELQVSTDAPSDIDPIGLQEGTATFSQTAFGITSPDQVYDGIDAAWTVLSGPQVSLPIGMTHTVLGDDSILVSGTIPDTGEYRVSYQLPSGGITGIRLEVLEHSSLPLNGPGYHAGNGNFLLTELVVTADILAAVPSLGASGRVVMTLTLVASGLLLMSRDALRAPKRSC